MRRTPSPKPRMWQRRPTAARTSRTRRSRRIARSPTSGRTGRWSCRRRRTSTIRATCWRRCSDCRSTRCACSTTRARARFGRSCYEDAAQAAAVMSQAVGKPVRVQFMRADELGWDDYGPAHLADVRAGIDASGKLVAYEYHGWQHGWMVNETTHELVLLTPPTERTTGA